MKFIYARDIAEYLGRIEEIRMQWGTVWYRGVSSTRYKPIPGLVWRNLVIKEATLIHRFLVHYRAIVGNVNFEQWELYALMQHHGLPTRLLDWTRSPLVALFFAMENYQDDSGEAGVWIMNPWQLNELSVGSRSVYCPSELRSKVIYCSAGNELHLDSYLPPALDESDAVHYPKHPLAIETPLNSPRIKAQQGCFTIHGSDESPLDELFFSENIENPEFCLIKIKGLAIRDKLMQSLRAMGIAEDSIYQDLDSLSQRILREMA